MQLLIQPQVGKIYAYEVNGFGSFNLMDDANVPSLVVIALFKCSSNNDIDLSEYKKICSFSKQSILSLKAKQAKALAVRMQAWI